MRRLYEAFLPPLALALMLGFAACGGDDDDGGGESATTTASATGDDNDGDAPQGGDLESYFEELERIVVAADREQEAIGDTLDVTFDTEEDYVAAAQAALNESGQKFEAALLELASLEPPDEAAAEHDQYVTNLQAALVLLSQLGETVDDVSTGAEVDDAFNEMGPLVTDANQESEDACVALQKIADEYEIDVNLECLT